MKPLSDAIVGSIQAEFARAYTKHDGKTPRSWSVGNQQSLVILVEEVGEVARALTYDEGDTDNLVNELIQVATMAAAWADRLFVRGDS
jgi:NTP pyrophosphatase (non-canonical NTP hydrolase)